MRFKSQLCQAVAALALGLFWSVSGVGSVLHVDDDATPGGDGLSWQTPYRFLQDALADAAGGGVDEIRLAQGTYKPDLDEANPNGTGNRQAKFQMLDGLALVGGFAGIGAKDPDARDIEVFVTILSGDIGEIDSHVDNSYHVVSANGVDQTAVLDGLTVTRGRANGLAPNNRGAGMIIDNGIAEVVNCTFLHNSSTAMFPENEVALGGAIAAATSNLILNNCAFIENGVHGEISKGVLGGGAIQCYNSTITGTGCRFVSNTVSVSLSDGPAQGGAVRVVNSSVLTLTDCWFVNNLAQRDGFPTQPGDGGGLYVRSSTASLTNCVFVGNRTPVEKVIGRGAGIYATDADVALVNCLLSGNTIWYADGFGAGIYATSSNISVTNCTVTGNQIGPKTNIARGAGIFLDNGSVLSADNTILWGNTGGNGTLEETQVDLDNSSSATFDYCNVEGWAGQFGGSGNIGDDPLFVGGPSGTWTDDPKDGPGPGESVLTDSNAAFIPDELVGRTIHPYPSASPRAFIIANTATTITVLGLWYTAAGFSYEIFNYHVQPGSPGIDAADNTALPQDINTDLDGNPRFVDDPDTKDTGNGDPPIVDMGAYEFVPVLCPGDPDATLLFKPDQPYLSEADSPLDPESAGYVLENFEDGLFNIPGVSVSGGEVRFPGPFTDSVDLDDGVPDGFGTDGHSFLRSDGQTGITFTFDAKVLGQLPTQAGLVWTDGNPQAVVTFTAEDAQGICLVRTQVTLGDGVSNGTTAEDRFLGVAFADGIGALTISASVGGLEVDHVQFVLPCPWDLDASGNVGASDLLSLLVSWGPCQGCPADFDGNGSIGAADLLALLVNWGPCP